MGGAPHGKDGPEAEQGVARAGPQGRLHGSHGGPSHPGNKVVSSLRGAAQTWDILGSNQKMGVSGGPRAGGQKNTCHVGSCLRVTGDHQPPEARRGSGQGCRTSRGCPAQKAELGADTQGQAGRPQPARGISRALLATDSAFGRAESRGRARARSRPKEQQGAPADAGAARGGSGPRPPSPRQVAS